MSFRVWILSRAWALVPMGALSILLCADVRRLERVDYVSGLQGRAGLTDALDSRSSTGYAYGQRELIVPEAYEGSFHWIEETQQMFAQGEARVRRTDVENAPFGREVEAASPYRWWLGGLAWIGHAVSGKPIGLCVERAALYADPLLHGCVLCALAGWVAWRFGGFAAALLSMGLVTLFPFASAFLPGMPEQRGLEYALALGSLLALTAGLRPPKKEMPAAGSPSPKRARRWFAVAGILAGLGVWISVRTQVPIILGVALGVLGSAGLRRKSPLPGSAPTAWRIWAYSGAGSVLVGYVAEYFPSHMGSWNLAAVHPIYGLAWIGLGELMAGAEPRSAGEKPESPLRETAVQLLAWTAVASVPFAMWKTGSRGLFSPSLLWRHLTLLPHGASAASSWAWLRRDGFSSAAVATLLPLLLAAPAVWLVLRSTSRAESRSGLAIALGPLGVALGFAGWELSGWGVLDCALLGWVVAAAPEKGTLSGISGRCLLAGLMIAGGIAGMVQLWPWEAVGPGHPLTPRETEELVDRHLAHWLAGRTAESGVVVFAPPNETAALAYFGGLRGIGTFAPENQAGFGETLNIASVATMDEAWGDLRSRSVRFVVVPSWDPFFNRFAQLYLVNKFATRKNFFVGELLRWNLPLWLRAVPYQMPVGGGFEGQSVRVFEVVDEQSPAAAASRLAEYLVEMGDSDSAAIAGEALRRFPGDVGALSARAQVQNAQQDGPALEKTMGSLQARLSSGGDRYLPWDRRVSLAVVLARAGKIEPKIRS